MTVRKIIAGKQIKNVITISPSDTLAAAAELLARHRIGAVIVSSDGAVVDGILSERDIVRALAARGAACLHQTVGETMTPEVIGCHPEDSAHSVMEKMTTGRFRHMPVIDGGQMVGVISIGDVVKARIDEIEHENTALTDMIANTW